MIFISGGQLRVLKVYLNLIVHPVIDVLAEQARDNANHTKGN
jgi:hypothetical protein